MLTTKQVNSQSSAVTLYELPEAQSLRQLVLKRGLAIVKNCHFESDDSLVNYASRLSAYQSGLESQLLHWDFGPVMTMKSQQSPQNYLFSDEPVPLHWDGAFYKEPLFLVFYCTESSGSGGETTFCNTTQLVQSFAQADLKKLKQIKLGFKTEKKAHYGGEIKVDLLQTHPVTKKNILRFAEEVTTKLNPVERVVENDVANLVPQIEKKLEQYTYCHQWQVGDFIVVDNFSYIHGRKSLQINSERSFKRVQVM